MQPQPFGTEVDNGLPGSNRSIEPVGPSPRSETMPGRQKRKKSFPREMSSKHKTLNSDTESSDEAPSPISHATPYTIASSLPLGTAETTSELDSRHGSVVSDASIHDNSTEVVETKRGRGRPRKYPKNEEPKRPKRPRGRPRKNTNESVKTLCSTYIHQGGLLAGKLDQSRMPELLSQLRRGIAIAQYIQDSLDADGNLGETQMEYLESLAKNNVFY